MLNVPEIVTPLDVVPAGYEHIITATYSNGEIQLELVSSKADNRRVALASKLFQPTFPRFLFTDGTRRVTLSHLQVLYLLLAHRFKQFASLSGARVPYLGLIAQDMENLNKWNTYNTPNTYNKRKRIENSFAIIQYERLADLTKDLPAVLFNAPTLSKFPKNLSLSSVGAAERSNVVTLHSGDKQMFRAPAYRETEKGFYCIFKSGQNVPARMQSHVINDAYELASPGHSLIQQDNILSPEGIASAGGSIRSSESPLSGTSSFAEEKQIIPKDNTLRPAIVVFYPFDSSDRFIAGEGEASEAFASTLVRVSSYIEEHFASTIEVGTYEGDTQIGTTLLGEPVVLRGYKQVEIKEIIPVGQAKRVVYEGIREAGNARVVSNTGLKCVTKTVKDTGTVTFEGLPPITPDLVIGMNSNKGKSNAIVLAQACLATHLGLYTPKKNGLLNSLDEEEINTAASKLPPFTYSKHENVYVGLVYMQFTELCSTYTAMREQAFAFEAGRVIHDNSPELYQYIWDNYLEEDKIAAAKELFSIYTQAHAPLPSYDVEEARKVFTHNHLVLNTIQQFPSDSILLDEEWNKGFYVCGIRIPSAASLSLFSGMLQTGETIYHVNLVNASKIILEVLTKGKVSDYTLERYKKGIKDTLYSSQRLVQSFIKPKIPGIGMKQIALEGLPPNTVLITNDRIYNKLKAESRRRYASGSSARSRASSLGSEKGAPIITTTELELLLLAAEGDENRFAQSARSKASSLEKSRAIFEKLKEDAPYALVVRNPALWSQQVIKVKVWDRKMFDIYLKLELGIESHLAPRRNDDVMFVHYDIMRASHSDSDGDTLPLFMLDYEGQQLLKDFEVRNTTEAESLWHDAYVEKERSSGEELFQEHKYKLHFVAYEDYSKYLSNAVVCKTLTGSSTLGLWAWSSILSLYRAYYDKHNGIYEKKGHKIALSPLSEQEAARLEFEMIRMVQDLVINGIKHVQNGSEDFAPYMLNNIGDKRYETTVRKSLRGFDVPEELINKLFFIVRFAKEAHDMLKATQNFFSLYNKGRFPKDSEALDYWSSAIVDSTYFGKLLAPLFDIVTGEEAEAELDAWLASL